MALVAALSISTVCDATASAQPGTGPRETVNQTFSTTRPGTATGLRFSAAYHAAGNPRGNPPYMRRMVLYPPHGMRYDRRVPAQCTATDPELEVFGPAACPAGSRLAGGTTAGLFFDPVTHSIILDHYTHNVTLFNSRDGEIVLIQSEGYTVVHGRARSDESIEYDPPTCFPAPPTGQCPDNYILQLRTSLVTPPYTKISGHRVRSYATTPATCPTRGYWRTTFRFWWADGSIDTVVSKQACQRRRGHHHQSLRHRHHRSHSLRA